MFVLKVTFTNPCTHAYVYDNLYTYMYNSVLQILHTHTRTHTHTLFSQKALTLIPYRWYLYKKTRWHYSLLDFCYFTNFLTLLYFWLPMPDIIRGGLFITVFAFANGPLLLAVLLWRNSFVPHSTDKMTSLFIHISPAIALWGVRWSVLGNLLHKRVLRCLLS